MQTPIYLITDRLILKELGLKDEDLLLDLDSDPAVVKYLTDGTPSTREEIRDALGRVLVLYKKHGGKFGFWGAFEKSTDQFIGWFHFRPSKKDPDNTNRIELGYRLRQAYWGKGYASEASVALIEKGFSELGVTEVFAVTMKANWASQNVMKKVGLKFSNFYTEDLFPGKDKSAVEYSITKEHWKAPTTLL